MIHICANYKAQDKEVFVDYLPLNEKGEYEGGMTQGAKRIKVSDVDNEKGSIITCRVKDCNEPAKTVDHYYPYYCTYNLCEKHQGAKNPETCSHKDKKFIKHRIDDGKKVALHWCNDCMATIIYQRRVGK